MQTKTLIQDLLTENRYWTFWKSDWSTKIHIYWAGSTKWADILDTIRMKLGDDFGYERQIDLKNPDIKFA